MTQDFSLQRLFQLIAKQWVDNRRMYLFTILAMLSGLALVFLFWILFEGGSHFNEEPAYVIYFVGLFLCGTVFASLSFSMLGDKAKGTYWLGFPASHMEKLICTIFYNLIGFTVAYTLCFLVVENLAMVYARSATARSGGSFTPMDWSGGFAEVMPSILLAFFALQSLYLLGSVYFSRFQFILTTVLGGLLIFLFVITMVNAHEAFLPDNYSFQGTHVRSYGDYPTPDGMYKRYAYSPFVSNAVKFLGQYMWAPVFWCVAWWRLKEKQL